MLILTELFDMAVSDSIEQKSSLLYLGSCSNWTHCKQIQCVYVGGKYCSSPLLRCPFQLGSARLSSMRKRTPFHKLSRGFLQEKKLDKKWIEGWGTLKTHEETGAVTVPCGTHFIRLWMDLQSGCEPYSLTQISIFTGSSRFMCDKRDS